MPNVNGRNFSYDAKGKAAAAKKPVKAMKAMKVAEDSHDRLLEIPPEC